MEFDLAEQRAGAREQLRIADLMSLAPGGDRVLEIGARDCYLSRRLTALYREVTALDLRKPEIDEPGIVPVQGDVTALDFADGSFDTVFCTEVLEHVPPQKLRQACGEIAAGFFPLWVLDRRALSSRICARTGRGARAAGPSIRRPVT